MSIFLLAFLVTIAQDPSPATKRRSTPKGRQAVGDEVVRRGDSIVVLSAQAELRTSQRIVGIVKAGERYKVRATKDGWVGLLLNEAGKEITGWIEQHHVKRFRAPKVKSPPKSRSFTKSPNEGRGLSVLRPGDLDFSETEKRELLKIRESELPSATKASLSALARMLPGDWVGVWVTDKKPLWFFEFHLTIPPHSNNLTLITLQLAPRLDPPRPAIEIRIEIPNERIANVTVAERHEKKRELWYQAELSLQLKKGSVASLSKWKLNDKWRKSEKRTDLIAVKLTKGSGLVRVASEESSEDWLLGKVTNERAIFLWEKTRVLLKRRPRKASSHSQ